MADHDLGLKRSKRDRELFGHPERGWLTDWRVSVRRPDGRIRQFHLPRAVQAGMVVGAVALAFWAGVATTLLSQRPGELAAKERQLDELLAANRAAQYRMTATEKLVADITREIDTVHANLQTLAESSDVLAKDQPFKLTMGKPRTPDADSDGADPAEASAVRARVRALEASLSRLHLAYSKAVQQVADSAGARISETESRLSRLGLDPMRIFGVTARNSDQGGQGGPFIPLRGPIAEDIGMSAMIDRIQHWAGVKAALQRLPLAEPIHGAYDFNSPFGARNDPLNNRTGIHEGIDLGAAWGTPVYATGDGVVLFTGTKARYGLTIDIDHGNGVTSRFAHLSRIKVEPGQKVTRATIIGLLGNTGRSTGPHLHYEVRLNNAPHDPVKFISAGRDARKTW